MKRARTLTVLALGWLGTAARADDLGWKTADVPAAAPAPKAVPVPPPVRPEPQPVLEMPWKTAEPRTLPSVPPSAPLSMKTDATFRSVGAPQPSPTGGLEPLPPPAAPPTPDRDTAPAPPAGTRMVSDQRFPVELPTLPLLELPKAPPTEPLQSPRAVPNPPTLNPRPVCNDTPEGPAPSATLQRSAAITPAEAGIPLRRHVFGSQPVRLSHDYFFRDLFGLDLLTNESTRAPRAPAPLIAADDQPDDSFFIQAEYLLWYANKPRIPVLATTNTLGQPGFLGQPGTQSLLGPGTFGPGLRDGFRVRAGGWLDECGLRGIDAGFFFLGRRSTTESFDSSQYPVITRPFFAPNFNGEFGEIVAQPNLSSGRLDITTDSYLWGADVNYRKAICRTCDRTYGWFAGYRYLNLTESLTIAESLTSTGRLSPDPVGTKVFVQDRFETRNQFNGGQVGGFWNRKFGRFDWDVRASVALGETQQRIAIDGLQQRTRPGEATQNFRGGLLATGPNLGTFYQSKFSVVPEITTNIGFQVTQNLKFYVGYNYLYWSNVVRPGDQIDRTVDVALVPNPPAGVVPSSTQRPVPTFRQSDFWAQGVQFGVEWRW